MQIKEENEKNSKKLLNKAIYDYLINHIENIDKANLRFLAVKQNNHKLNYLGEPIDANILLAEVLDLYTNVLMINRVFANGAYINLVPDEIKEQIVSVSSDYEKALFSKRFELNNFRPLTSDKINEVHAGLDDLVELGSKTTQKYMTLLHEVLKK